MNETVETMRVGPVPAAGFSNTHEVELLELKQINNLVMVRILWIEGPDAGSVKSLRFDLLREPEAFSAFVGPVTGLPATHVTDAIRELVLANPADYIGTRLLAERLNHVDCAFQPIRKAQTPVGIGYSPVEVCHAG